jgi:hypothetical protein
LREIVLTERATRSIASTGVENSWKGMISSGEATPSDTLTDIPQLLQTKHFQSIYWTSDVLIVDCPGLVFPSLTNVEMQVMSGSELCIGPFQLDMN